MYLFDNDQAVPPEEFLTPADLHAVGRLILTKKEKQKLTTMNNRRLEANPSAQPITEEQALRDKKAEKTVDRIFNRVKKAFPNNKDRVRVAMGTGSHHLTPRSTHTQALAGNLAQKLSSNRT